ncbi:TIR domain-containing protein [Alkalinema pantanalense CENA528]|uniref:TIR domain-containing protein n=1 Tax=Alkalinema pantanalense TaxID=1620705 RepID=UPI003D6F7CF9
MADVFISYSRKDKEFVKTLHNALVQNNRNTWVDWEDIPLAADWWREIERGIEAADTFVFVISPDSVTSKVCRQEIDHAVQHNKRLVPILWRDDFDMQPVHPMLQKHNWLFCRESDDFDRAFQDLITVIDTDLDYIRAHTRLLVRAIEWEQHRRDDSFLLRGNDLKTADRWLSQGLEREPKPTPLQTQYILASGQAETQRQRQARMVSTIGFIGAIGLALVAFTQYQQAKQRQLEAETGQMLALSTSVDAYLASNQEIEALIAAIKLGQKLQQVSDVEPATKEQAIRTLQEAVYAVKEQNRLEGHSDYVRQASFSPDGQTIATASDDRTVKLWRRDGTLLKTFQNSRSYVWSVAFSPDGQTLATSGTDSTVKLWDRSGKLLRTLKGHQDVVTYVVFSPDGQTLASSSYDNTVKLWNHEGKLLKTLVGHYDQVNRVAFSPDGKYIATASSDRTLKLWNTDGTLLKTLRGHRQEVWSVSFSSDGKTLASGSGDKTIKLWKSDGTLIKTLTGHSKGILTVKFSPNGQMLASGSSDKTIKLWKTDGTFLQTLRGHNDELTDVNFSPDSQTLTSTSSDGTARLWRLHSPLLTSLSGSSSLLGSIRFGAGGDIFLFEQGAITRWKPDGTLIKTIPINQEYNDNSFSPAGQFYALLSAQNIITLWRTDGSLVRAFPQLPSPTDNLKFSLDGQTLASLSRQDQKLILWNLEGTKLKTFQGPIEWNDYSRISPTLQEVLSVRSNEAKLWRQDGSLITKLQNSSEIIDAGFSPNGETIVTTSYDKVAKLWNRDGKLLTTLKGHASFIVQVAFSSDGNQVATIARDNTIKLWKQDGTLLTTLKVEGNLLSIAFSPDNKMLSFVVENAAYLWNISDLTDSKALITKGCTLLQDYLVSHPKRLLELEACQTQPQALIAAGQVMAFEDNTPAAVQLFRKARQLDPKLQLDPDREAQRFANQGQAERLITEAQTAASEERLQTAIEHLQKAVQLNPELSLNPTQEAQRLLQQAQASRLVDEAQTLAQQGQVKPALEKFQAAVKLNPDLPYVPAEEVRLFHAIGLIDQAFRQIRGNNILPAIEVIQQAEALNPPIFNIRDSWAYLCWTGSLLGYADQAMNACEKSVKASPSNGDYRQNRGVARALTGDVTGAIEDLQAFVDWTNDDDRKIKRQAWIDSLKAGQNPFTPQMLQTLRQKET